MSVDYNKAPFPWFGGKKHAAEHVWAAMGDVSHYVEPFMGSVATLLQRPHLANRPYHSETVNDLDGLLVNAWRAIQQHPDAVADAASWPVSEVDLMARHLALVRWREEGIGRMRADPDYCDPKMAGWWLWGQSSWIGSGWCSGTGPWTISPTGGVVKQAIRGRREPGVDSKRPHLTTGQGVNHAGTREPGVDSKRPHLANNGQGVNRPQLREPGVDSKRPHLANNGQGVNHAGTREPGVGDFHPMTMPELRNWMRYLSARLRHVRILQGDWRRAVTGGASKTLPVRQGNGACGVFLDPPYGDVRTADLYAHDSLSVADDVRAWCLEHGTDPDYRIVLAGFDTEHAALESHGWRVVEWFTAGFLRGGMGNTGGDDSEGHAQKRERLWMSPHCIGGREARQSTMFGGGK